MDLLINFYSVWKCKLGVKNKTNRRGLIIYTGILIKQWLAHSNLLHQLIKLASAKQKSYTMCPNYKIQPGDAFFPPPYTWLNKHTLHSWAKDTC